MNKAMKLYKSPMWLRYAIPVLAVVVTIGLRIALVDWVEGRYPLILFIVPVIIATWFGGTGPGLLATLCVILGGAALFKPYNLQIDSLLGVQRMALFCVVSGSAIFIISQLHTALFRAEENERKLQREILDRKKVEEDLRKEVDVRARTETALVDALKKAEAANNAKSEFLANMSHEIRTPMNAVVGLTNILKLTSPLTDKQKEFIATLKLSADSLLALINDMLDLAKIEASSVELENIPFNLRTITDEVMTMMALKAKEKRLEFAIDASALEHRDFVGDPTRVKQIMMNLCSNAIKFTHTGTVSISLSAKAVTADMYSVGIAVHDTGIGIASDKIGNIFDKFIQGDSTINRRYGGSGLGLAIAKTLTELMGGDIYVESHYGVGSVFTAKIPLRKAAAQSSKIMPDVERLMAAPRNPKTGLKILLVEDHPANILVAGTFLEHFGFAYDVATDGAQALQKVASTHYLTVLMDVQMQGLNGFQTTRMIRENEHASHKPRLYIIGMTAHALTGDRERCLDAGMDDYIAKPFDPNELERKLKSLSFERRELPSTTISPSKAQAR